MIPANGYRFIIGILLSFIVLAVTDTGDAYAANIEYYVNGSLEGFYASYGSWTDIGLNNTSVQFAMPASSSTGFGGATLKVAAADTRITITDMLFNGVCQGQQCPSSYTLVLKITEMNVPAGGLSLHLDGNVTTSNPDGPWISTYINVYHNGSGQALNTGGYIPDIAYHPSGDFHKSWYTPERADATLFTQMFWSFTIGGIFAGDKIEIPGSLGLDYNAPEPSSVPEPASLLLLGSGLGVIGFAAYRRKK